MFPSRLGQCQRENKQEWQTERDKGIERDREVRREDDGAQNRGKEKYEASFWEEGGGCSERSVGKINTVCRATGRDNQSCLTLITQHSVCVRVRVCATYTICTTYTTHICLRYKNSPHSWFWISVNSLATSYICYIILIVLVKWEHF